MAVSKRLKAIFKTIMSTAITLSAAITTFFLILAGSILIIIFIGSTAYIDIQS